MSASTVLTGVTLSLICLLTAASNVLVFAALVYSRPLRTTSNMFIVSLSVADILVATMVMVPATVNQIYGRWVFSPGFCAVWASSDVMLCSASVLNVCAISFDRYLAIISPLRYKTLMTFRRALYLLAVLWTLSILSSFVPITQGWHNPALPTLFNLTLLDSQPQCILVVSLPYALAAGAITIMIPIIIALVLYRKVSEEARRQALFVRTLIAPSRVLLGQDVSSKSVREPFTRKATVTLGVIVGAYVVTWTPFLVTNIVDAACMCVPPNLFTAIVWLGYCNSLINPIIYPLLMRDFRKVYLKMLTACCPIVGRLTQKKSEVARREKNKPLTNGHPNTGDKSDSV